MSQHLLLKDGRSGVQHHHVHLSIGELLQSAHQRQMPLPTHCGIGIIPEQDGNVHI